jgi:subtilisin family serine protease
MSNPVRRSRRSIRRQFCEQLEPRRLLAFNAAGHLINQDTAQAAYPNLTGAGVTVAVMDTGIDYTHPQLGGGFGPGFKVKGGWDFVDNDADPMDTFGHGTNVAGIIAAKPFTIGTTQYSGIAPDASLVALRVSADGSLVTDQTIDQALKWLETNYQSLGVSVLNFSFGGGIYTGDHTEPVVSDDLAQLRADGITIVSPTGNNGTAQEGINWPAADPSVLAAGSVAVDDTISSFTQIGHNMDLLAPGEGIGTTARGGGFATVSLSSFSAPMVSGAAALLKQADPSLKPDDILSNLKAGGVLHKNTTFGTNFFPRIDLFNSLTLALQRKPNSGTDVGTSGANSDMAFDAQGVLHFVYYDQATHTIKYATRDTAGLWSATRTIDKTGNDVGATLSLALDPAGKPAVAYYNATSGDLDYAQYSGTKWKISTLDSKNIVGQFPSLAFDSNGNPIVSYYRKTSGDLRVMRSDGTTWTRADIQTTDDVGQWDSLTISKSGTIGVAYNDNTTGNLMYASLNGSTWTSEQVDDLQGAAFISLAFDNNNHPAISYYDAFPADLKYATKATGAWAAETLGRKGAQGLYTNLWFDNSNVANILYFNRKANALYHIHGSSGNWTADTVSLSGGALATAAQNAGGTEVAYGYFDTKKLKLLTGDLL